VPVRTLAAHEVSAIGQSTAARLTEAGIHVTHIPDDFLAEGLLALLSLEKVQGKRLLIPRAEDGRDVLRDELQARGAQVEVIPFYRTVRPAAESVASTLAEITAHPVEALLFSSGSTVNNFSTLFGSVTQTQAYCRDKVVAVIGPITAKACHKLGIPVTVTPARATLPDLVDALATHFCRKKGETSYAIPSV
jgi:uroporphyrinogen III methyltransferase/synthase